MGCTCGHDGRGWIDIAVRHDIDRGMTIIRVSVVTFDNRVPQTIEPHLFKANAGGHENQTLQTFVKS